MPLRGLCFTAIGELVYLSLASDGRRAKHLPPCLSFAITLATQLHSRKALAWRDFNIYVLAFLYLSA